MKWWFIKRRSINLGKYVAPEERPEPALAELIDEAMLIAAAGVRIAVKNLIILRSARDRENYDLEYYRDAVRQELANLASEKEGDALRIGDESAAAIAKRGQPTHHSDYRQGDSPRLHRREHVSRGLAERLRALSADDDYVERVVTVSIAAAWDEIAESVTGNLLRAVGDSDPSYAKGRDARIRLVLQDLAELDPTY